MFQMSFGASRATRLLFAAAVACLGLALSAQAAHATYSKIQIVKINQNSDATEVANDVFTFDTSLTPSPSPASFTLKGGQASSVFSVECNASSACTSKWGTLTQTVTERQAAGYTLTGVVCRSTTGSGTWGAAPGPTTPIDKDTTFDPATRKITFKLDWWEQIKCEVTNTRDTGTIKVTKKVVAPAGDTGKFNLLVDGAAKASNVGDGGTTGVQTVNTGTHAVGETAGTGTSLADYAASTSCVDKAHPATPADTDGNLAVAKGDQWECVITNTRKTATIKVTKVLAPATDAGRFNLLVDGQAKAWNIGNGGTTGVQTVLPGAHTVGETASAGTTLADYDSATSCLKTGTYGPADTDGSVTVAAGDAWECVITNTRKTGTIKVTKKVVAPAGDTGKFNLLVDGTAKATNVGDGGTTGVQSVTTGTHTVGETAGTGTSLADYAASTSCVDKAHPATPADTDGNLAVAKGDQWECVITNTRGVGTIKVTKALAPVTDTGKFNLLIDGQAKATDVGDGGTTGVQTVLPGTHTVGESAGTGSDLANYDATLSCTDTAHTSDPADMDGSVQVDAGDAWECVITNARKGSPPPQPPTDQPPAEQPVSPQIAVSPARVRPGSARLSGPSGCPTTSAVSASVSGRRIVKVTFYVDGRKVKTLTKANRNGQWVLPMNVKRFAFGTHRVRVTVQFAKSSQTKAKTLRLSFNRCHPAVVTPKFTG